MIPDHYAILGVAPTASPAVIRAAYLALMREYHPDRNPSPAATLRAQAIIAAYKVLGDYDRRQEYDWDRRRAREAAATVSARPGRRLPAGLAAAAAIGLVAAVAVMLRPNARPEKVPAPGAVVVETAKPRSVAVRPAKRVVVATRAIPAPIKPRVEPIRMIVAVEPVEKQVPKEPPKKPATVRMAAVEPVKPKVKDATVEPVRAKPKLAAVAAPPPRPAAGAATDLASLDQFVMSFYGQSWRYGDARKRAALVQSRDSFVVRRGTCAAEACKRAAYLKLMRDVSAIVESGQPAR